MPMIDITKGDNKTEDVVDREDTVQQMETAVNVFCEHLMVKHNQFDEKATFDELINYISKYQRILYSPISNKIYSFYEKNEGNTIIKHSCCSCNGNYNNIGKYKKFSIKGNVKIRYKQKYRSCRNN